MQSKQITINVLIFLFFKWCDDIQCLEILMTNSIKIQTNTVKLCFNLEILSC